MELSGALVGIGAAGFFASFSLLAKALFSKTDKKKWLLLMAGSILVFLIGMQMGATSLPSTTKSTSPGPTPTPTAGGSPRIGVTAGTLTETAYIRNVNRERQNIGSILSNLEKLFTQPNWDDPRWIDSATRGIQQFNAILDEAEKLQPPQSMQELHEAYMENVRDWRVVLNYWAQAVASPEARADPDHAFAQAGERAIASAKKVEALVTAAENKSK